MKSRITAILVDDEILALKRLRRLLEKFSGFIDVAGESQGGEEAVNLINTVKPDVVFLDIEMPGLNGFELLEKIKVSPSVIFVTAFDEYAVKAFEENSVDYLLKPVELPRLEKTIEKLKRTGTVQTEDLKEQVAHILKEINTKKEVKSVPVKIGDKILLIPVEKICYFEAKEKYVFIVTDENVEYLTDFTLTGLEEKLSDPFLRVHRAYMVNRDKIKEVHRGFNGTFILTMKDKNGTRINTGRSYNDVVRQFFEL